MNYTSHTEANRAKMYQHLCDETKKNGVKF